MSSMTCGYEALNAWRSDSQPITLGEAWQAFGPDEAVSAKKLTQCFDKFAPS
ncbi:MAG TPA: hypothetical protein V6D03_00450 [Candidatus Caenarcaniphilales bacterium]